MQCSFFKLCEQCQAIQDTEEKKLLEIVAGKLDFQLTSANSVLNIFPIRDEAEAETTENKADIEDLNLMKNIETEIQAEERDMRINQLVLIKKKHCLKLKNEIKAKKYMQCSSFDDESVQDVMANAIELAYDHHRKNLKKETKTIQNDLKNVTKRVLDLSIDSIQIEPNLDTTPNSILDDSLTQKNTLQG